MSKLIDADQFVIETITSLTRTYDTPSQSAYWNGVDMVLNRIDRAPAVDAAPVVHGRWMNPTERKKSFIRICTHCHKVSYNCALDRPYEFCPRCGAIMDAQEGAEK